MLNITHTYENDSNMDNVMIKVGMVGHAMASKAMALEALVNPLVDVSKAVENVEVKLENKNVSISQINSKRNKEFKKHSLYSAYQDIKFMLNQCVPTVEAFTEEVNGELILNEAANIMLGVHPDLAEAFSLLTKEWIVIQNDLEATKKAWIKQKVMTDRYTHRGAKFMEKLADIGDRAFAFSGVCIELESTLVNLAGEAEDVK